MQIEQQQIKEFMLKAEQVCPNKPTDIEENTKVLRYKLIHEELQELDTAMGYPDRGGMHYYEADLPEVADAITDLLVVVIGTAVAFGIDIQPVWDEVHRSNMSKFIDGHKREDGKWIKGPSYSPANIKPIIDAQMNFQQENSQLPL